MYPLELHSSIPNALRLTEAVAIHVQVQACRKDRRMLQRQADVQITFRPFCLCAHLPTRQITQDCGQAGQRYFALTGCSEFWRGEGRVAATCVGGGMGACATLGDCGRGVPLTPETQVARFCGADGSGQRWRRCEDRGGSGMGWGRAPGASIGTSKSGSNMCCVIHASAASADHESAASADNVGVALTARLQRRSTRRTRAVCACVRVLCTGAVCRQRAGFMGGSNG